MASQRKIFQEEHQRYRLFIWAYSINGLVITNFVVLWPLLSFLLFFFGLLVGIGDFLHHVFSLFRCCYCGISLCPLCFFFPGPAECAKRLNNNLNINNNATRTTRRLRKIDLESNILRVLVLVSVIGQSQRMPCSKHHVDNMVF